MFDWFKATYWPGSIMRVNCSVLILMSFIVYTLQSEASGETITLQNDVLAQGTSAAVQTGFQANDIAASVFNLPPGVEAMKITRVDLVMQVDPAYIAFETFCDSALVLRGSA